MEFMRSVAPATRLLTAAGVVSLATACGGGSDGASGASLKQFAGFWRSPCVTVNARQSTQTLLDIRDNATTDSQLSGQRIVVQFNNSSCQGSGDTFLGFFLDGVAAGARQTALGEANMVVLQYHGQNGNTTSVPADTADLMLISNGRLYFGNRAQIAPDGFPTEIDPSIAWTR